MGVRRTRGIEIRTEGYFSMQANPTWDRSKNEIVYLTLHATTKAQYNFSFSLFVAFDEVEGINGEPAIPILNQTVVEIERILVGLEAEARRLDLIS